MSRILKRNWGPIAALVLCAVTMIWVASARGVATRYASTSGSGTTCSFASPCNWDTLVCASGAVTPCGANKLLPGDTGMLRGGTYPASKKNAAGSGVNLTGTLAAPITIENYQDGTPYGEEVIIDPSIGTTLGGIGQAGVAPDGMNLWVSSYVIVKGLVCDNLSTGSRHFPNNGSGNAYPLDRNNNFAGGWAGISFINNFSMNGIVGFQRGTANTSSQSGATYYGNISLYNGGDYVVNGRGGGHEMYLQNQGDFGTTAPPVNVPVVNTDNIVAYDFYQDWHNYAEGGDLMRMQNFNNAIVQSGMLSVLTPGLVGEVIAGGNGTPGGIGSGSGCAEASASGKISYQTIWMGNLFYGNSGDPFSMQAGYLKGWCDGTLVNNHLDADGGTSLVLGPQEQNPSGSTITCSGGTIVNGLCMYGNRFIGTTVPYAGCSPATCGGAGIPASGPLNVTYPNNTYLASKPSSGKDFIYHPNQYQVGRGWVSVENWDHSSTVTVSPHLMGAYAGENWKLCYYLDPLPWTCTAITTGTNYDGSSAVSVNTTGLNVVQPTGTNFVAPTETGPELVIYLLYDTGSGAATPTPTNTQTSTNTPTTIATPTFTPTFTPTRTITNTPTLTGTLTPSLTPTPTRTFTLTPTTTPSFTPTVTPTSTVTPLVNTVSFSVNSGPCVLGGQNGSITADPLAQGGYYFTSTVADDGTLTCTVSLKAGTYRMWEQVLAADPTSDSLFFSFNGDQGFAATATPTGSNTPTRTATRTPTSTGTLTPSTTPTNTPTGPTPTRTPNLAGMGDGDTTNPDIFDEAESLQPCSGPASCNYESNWSSLYQWQIHNDRSWGCGNCSGVGTERQIVVPADGTYTLAWRVREVGARLSYVYLTCPTCNAPVFFQTPTPGPPICPYTFVCKHNPALKLMAPCNQPVKNPCAGN